MKARIWFGPGLAVLLSAGGCQAQNESQNVPPLSDILTCQTDMDAYRQLSPELLAGGPVMKKLGLTKTAPAEYRPSKPIRLYDKPIHSVIFSAKGPMAVLDTADVDSVAQAMEITTEYDPAGNVIGERTVDQAFSAVGDQSFFLAASLKLATSPAYPEKTLAGCEYLVEKK